MDTKTKSGLHSTPGGGPLYGKRPAAINRTLRIDLEGCYGIKSFRAELEFSGERRHAAIYAPNGTMKTSLARTFEDLGPRDDPDKKESRDRLSPSAPYRRLIEYECGPDGPAGGGSTRRLHSGDVLVLRPRELDADMAEASSKILVSQELRKERSAVYGGLIAKKDALLKWLAGKSGLDERGVKETIIRDFGGDATKVEQFLEIIDENSGLDPDDFAHFDGVKYGDVFSEKALAVITTDKFRRLANEYVAKYRQLIKGSLYFTDDFDHDQATTAKKRLTSTNFFKAGHRVTLVPGKAAPGKAAPGKAAPKEIDGEDSFQDAINSEIERIRKGAGLEWDQIDKILSKNAETKSLRRLLAGNARLLDALKEPAAARQSLWRSYLSAEGSPGEDLASAYRACKDKLADIDRRAAEEGTLWDEVVAQFNKRFDLPVDLHVANRSHALLDGEVAALEFLFDVGGQRKPVTYAELNGILSEGEKRALYMLYGLFKIEQRTRDGQKTLLVVDDIVDSFDYKSKHAIMQYLYEVSDREIFNFLILTHNFDFFRNVNHRIVDYNRCYYATKSDDGIRLTEAHWVRGPLGYMLNNLSRPENLVAAVAFARNMREHSHGTGDGWYCMLSSVLHYRADTDSIVVGKVIEALEEIFPKNQAGIDKLTYDTSEKMTRFVERAAEEIAGRPDSMTLAEKIVLAVYARVAAERFLASRIHEETGGPDKEPSTCALVRKYREGVGSGEDKEMLDTLDRVCLTTSEIIHINSFMYEPILDMSGDSLARLYRDVRALAKDGGGA